MSWNEPGANPLADLDRYFQERKETDFPPNRMIIGAYAYVELVLWSMDFGWWPMRWFRKRRERKRLRAEFQAAAEI